MPATINRLAIQNKTVSVRKSTKVPLTKFNTLDFPKGKFYIEPVVTTNEPKKSWWYSIYHHQLCHQILYHKYSMIVGLRFHRK